MADVDDVGSHFPLVQTHLALQGDGNMEIRCISVLLLSSCDFVQTLQVTRTQHYGILRRSLYFIRSFVFTIINLILLKCIANGRNRAAVVRGVAARLRSRGTQHIEQPSTSTPLRSICLPSLGHTDMFMIDDRDNNKQIN